MQVSPNAVCNVSGVSDVLSHFSNKQPYVYTFACVYFYMDQRGIKFMIVNL